MKRFYLFAVALLAVAFVGCKEDEPVEVITPNPTVEIEAGDVTTESITFTVTSTDAESCAYMLYDSEVPTAEDVLANGSAVEVNKTVEITVEDLDKDTEYNVAAAVKSGELTAIKTITMTTAKPEDPTVSVTAGAVTNSTITFSVTSTNAEKVTYVVTTDEVPETDLILVNGTDIDINTTVEVTIKDLTPGTTYKVKAAARTGVVRVGSEIVEITTEEYAYPAAPEAANCIIKGAHNNTNSFELRMMRLDKNFIMNVEVGSTGELLGIMPEGEYIFDADASFGESEYDFWCKSDDMVSGHMVVSHLSEGYRILVQGLANGGAEVNYLFEGVMEPSNSSAYIGNPPIPYNDTTINTTITSVVGSHYQPSEWFNLSIETEAGYSIDMSLQTPSEVGDGIIPEARYTLDGEYVLTSYSNMTFMIEDYEATLMFVEGSYMDVEHLESGYRLTLHAVNGLKTKIDAVFEGIIATDPNQNHDFVNPGVAFEADLEFVLTSAKYSGTTSDGRGEIWKMTNEDGVTASVCFNANKVVDGMPLEGAYTLVNGFEDWDISYNPEAFQVSGNDSPMTFTYYNEDNELQTMQYPAYPCPGMVYVEKSGDVYTVTLEGQVWLGGFKENQNKKVRWTYTGAL